MSFAFAVYMHADTETGYSLYVWVTSSTLATVLPQHCLKGASPTATKETLFKEHFGYEAEDDVELILRMGRIHEKDESQHSTLVTHNPMSFKRVRIKFLSRYKHQSILRFKRT